MIILAGLAAALTVLAGWLFFAAYRPLRRLTELSGRMLGGDLAVRFPEYPGGIRALGKILNALAQRLREGSQELSQGKSEVLAILSSMIEGVVALDHQGRILFINPAMERLFGVDPSDAQHKIFLEVFRHHPLQDVLTSVLDHRAPLVQEIQLFLPQETFFEVHAASLALPESQENGVLIVLHDITRLRKLERIRREFVANVSHELKTPLASIRGFAETLLTGGLEDSKHRQEFVQIIENQANQLSRLVDDLLDLSAIESGQREWHWESLDLADLLRQTSQELETLARKKNIQVKLSVPQGLPSVPGDRQALKQVFTNLLDNAIKYNKNGGLVEIQVQQLEKGLKISLKDTGPGIAAEALSRIFERFYRVDKARSRDLGGTGLGLSIVKHLVEAHRGSVSVESRPGQGSTFSIFLPF